MITKYLKLMTLVSILSSCALMDSRDFENEMDEYRSDDPMFIAGEDFEIASGDTGESFRDYETIINRTPPTERMSEDTKYRKSLRNELLALEKNLSESEFRTYSYVEGSLGNDSEKIYYLGLTNDEKRSYLELKGLRKPNTNSYRSIASSVGSTLRMGMSMSDVVNHLGYPVTKEVAGSYGEQAERWLYNRNGQTSYVYFENSRLQGWE